MNPFILTPMEQIRAWRDLRDELADKSLYQQLKLVSDYWWQAPIVTFCLDSDKPDTWPSPWEIVYYNGYDTTARALMMAETLILFDEKFSNLVELQYIKDYVDEDLLMILVIDGKILNHSYKTITSVDKLQGHYTILGSYCKHSEKWTYCNDS